MTVGIGRRQRSASIKGSLGLGALVVLGCSDPVSVRSFDEPRATFGTSVQALEGDAGVEAPPELADAGASAPGLYLLGKFVDVEEGQVTFVDTALASEPAQLADFDPAAAGLSFAEAQLAVPFGNAVFVSDAFTPVITRFELDEAGKLVSGASLSFAEAGLEFVSGWSLSVVSETKAYLFDSASSRAIVWDPSAMQLTGTEIDLSAAVRDGYTFDVGPREGRTRGERLFVPVYWYDADFFSRKAGGVFVIDTVNDTVTLSEDERCATYSLVTLPSGEIYSFPDGYFAQEFYLDAEPREPLCALRINADAEAFDAEYSLDLGALVGAGSDAGGGVQGGIGDGHGGIYLSVADEQRYADGEENVYRPWRWDLATGTASEQPDLPYWNAYMGSYTSGDQVLAVLPGVETTTVVELSSPSPAAFELSGWIEPLVKLR